MRVLRPLPSCVSACSSLRYFSTYSSFLLLALLFGPLVNLAFAASSGCDGAGNCYIRAGASGSGSGADWTNAYTGFGTGAGQVDPSSMSRGVTYWIANGAYGARSFSTADSGSSVITVEGATISGHGPASDWSDLYAGQATFIGDNAITTDYWTFNGQSGSGCSYPNPNASCYSIKFWNQRDGAGAALNISGVTNVTLQYIEMEGTGDGFPNNSATSDRCNPNGGTGSCPSDNGGIWVDNGIYEGRPDTNLYVGYSYVHNTGNTQFQMNASGSGGSVNNNTTWEYDWVSYNHTGMNAGHDEAYSLYGSNVTIRYNIFQDIAGTGTITTAGAGQPPLQNWYVYGNLFFWDPTYALYNGDYYLAINDLGIIAFLGEQMSGSVVFANNTIAGMYNHEMDAPGAGAATYAMGTNNSSPSNGGSTCGSTCPTVTVENNLWVGDGYANNNNYCSVVTGATCTYDFNAAWEDSVPNGSNWQTDGHTHDYNVSGVTNPFINLSLSTIAGYQLSAPDPFTSHAGTSLTNSGTYWNGTSNAPNTFTVDMLNVTRGADGTWDRGALQLNTSNLGTLQSIAVTPANPSIVANNTEQFTATGTYSSGSTQDITSSVTWTSGTTGIATVSNNGLATGLAAGTSTITATSGSISGSTVLTVTAPVLQSIAVTPANASVFAGATEQYTATATYNNGTTQNITSSVTWGSTNASAATINSAGLANAVAAGTTTITAVSGSVTGSTTLTVKTPVLQSIDITPADAFVTAGGTTQYTATGTYSNGTTQNITSQVTWSSSNQTVATILGSGLVSALTNGTSTITATLGSVSGSTLLTVTAAALQSIVVTPANDSVAAGATVQYTATGTFSNGTTQNITSSVRWTSSSRGVAAISGSGLATTAAAGTTAIAATSGSIVGSTTLTVTAPTLQSIAVTPANDSVAAGATVQYAATGTYSNGTTQNITSSVTWSSSSTATATISSAGLARALAVGTSTITATSGAISGSTTLTVTAAILQSIAVTPANASITAGATQQYTATGTYSNGTTQNVTSSVTWTSSNGGAATISGTGLATAVAAGTATIRAATGGISGSTTLTVTSVTTATLQSITVTPANASVAPGTTEQYTATGTYSNGTTQNITGSVTWRSSNTGVATINSSGLATTVALGETVITATSGSVTGSTGLTVTAVSAQGFTLGATPSTLSIAEGASGSETVTATPANGYTGTVQLTVDFGSADSILQNLCGGFSASQKAQGSIAITSSSPASATFTLDTNSSDCANAANATRTGLHPIGQLAENSNLSKKDEGPKLPRPLPAGVSFAGLVLIGYFGRRSRKLRNITAVLIVLLAVFSLSACGGTTSLVAGNPPPGTYTGTITGHDSSNASLTSTTTFKLVIQ